MAGVDALMLFGGFAKPPARITVESRPVGYAPRGAEIAAAACLAL